MKIFSIFTLFLGIVNAVSFKDLAKYRNTCVKEEGVNLKTFDEKKEQCVFRCTLDKLGIISKEGKFSAAFYTDSREKKFAIKCFELTQVMTACKRAVEFFICMSKKLIDLKCSKDLGYNVDNPNDPKRRCDQRCKLMELRILTPNGELNEAMLDPSSNLIDKACFEKYRNEEPCCRAAKYNACVAFSTYEIFCREKLAKTPNADCISACAMENLGDLTDKSQLNLEKIPIGFRSEALRCYNLATRWKKCKLADEYRKCLYKETILKV